MRNHYLYRRSELKLSKEIDKAKHQRPEKLKLIGKANCFFNFLTIRPISFSITLLV